MRYLCLFGVKKLLKLIIKIYFFDPIAVTFLKHWKQKNAEISHRWDLMEFEEEEVIILLFKKNKMIKFVL
jgi:hypothetical protein